MTSPSIAGRAVVPDSEGLARAVARDTYIAAVIKAARDTLSPVVVSAATIVEVAHPRLDRAALRWPLSRPSVEPVSDQIAANASALLADAGLHGHRHAMDAVVLATALALAGRTIIYTGDPQDMSRLIDGRATVVALPYSFSHPASTSTAPQVRIG